MPEPAVLERDATELLQRLIRFNTVNPPGREQAAQEFLRDHLEGAGFTVRLLSGVEGRPNLVARLPAASDGPTLAFLGHIDTVLADHHDWQVDPWEGLIRDGCVWGRGAVDMKSQVAAEVAAAVALARDGWRPQQGELKIVITADEEAGGAHGAQWLLANHPEEARADYVINEGAGPRFSFGGRHLYGVCTGEKGVFRFTVRARGEAGHASMPGIADNALVKLAPVLAALAEARIEPEDAPEPLALARSLGLDPGDLRASMATLAEEDPRLAALIVPMTGTTLSPTMAAASPKVNVIPAHAELKVDCRALPGRDEPHVWEHIQEVLGGIEDVDIAFDETVSGNRSRTETPLMEAIQLFVNREDPGAHAVPTLLPGFSDSRWWRAAFPECVAYGFYPQKAMGLLEATPLMHAADERMPIEDLAMASRFYAELMETMLA